MSFAWTRRCSEAATRSTSKQRSVVGPRTVSYLVDILSGDFGDPTLAARLSDPRETNRLVDTVAPKYAGPIASPDSARQLAAVSLRRWRSGR